VFHGIDRSDVQAKANGAVGGAAAALDHDADVPAEVHDVPDDEEVTCETQAIDEIEFAQELAFDIARDVRAVAVVCALDGGAAKKVLL
jgi:hypothetical protein